MKKSIYLLIALALPLASNAQNTYPYPSTGNIGIGTTSPQDNLDVKGQFRITNWTDVTEYTRLMTADDGSFTVKTPYGSNQLILKEDKVGFGVSSPETKLHVDGRGITFNRDGDHGQFLSFKRNNSPEWQFHAGVSGDDVLRIKNKDDETVYSVLQSKSIGIGTESTGSHKLAVNGSIGARAIKVEATGWSDFVFEDSYVLPTLNEVESYIQINKHLPAVPSEQMVINEGIDLGEMDAILLQKIEELTLYTIEQQKEIQQLKNENEYLKSLEIRLSALENK